MHSAAPAVVFVSAAAAGLRRLWQHYDGRFRGVMPSAAPAVVFVSVAAAGLRRLRRHYEHHLRGLYRGPRRLVMLRPHPSPRRVAMPFDPKAFEALVLEHVEAENARDPARTRATYCDDPIFYDVPMRKKLVGWPEILAAYEERWQGFPQMHRRVTRVQTDTQGTYVEITMAGRHEGLYRGLPPTGKHHELMICGHFSPAEDGRIKQETAYYDALTAAVYLDLLPDLDTPPGRLWLALHRPSVVLRTLLGRLRR
jgi:steroid delta-isomerase-like uncharacterized protein